MRRASRPSGRRTTPRGGSTLRSCHAHGAPIPPASIGRPESHAHPAVPGFDDATGAPHGIDREPGLRGGGTPRVHHPGYSTRLVRSTSSRMVRFLSAPTISGTEDIETRHAEALARFANRVASVFEDRHHRRPSRRERTHRIDGGRRSIACARRRSPPNCARYSEAVGFQALRSRARSPARPARTTRRGTTSSRPCARRTNARTRDTFSIHAHLYDDTIARDAASDGCWPLITNDRNLSGAEVLAAYK